MTIAVGETLPEASFKVVRDDKVVDVTTQEVFAGKKVVLIGVPGAFTPTCNNNHLPGYLDNYDALLAKGVDTVAVVAVNDQWVMAAWARFSGGEGRLIFLADGNGSFVSQLGLDADMSMAGFGRRSKRFSMLVEDGVVKALNVEEQRGQATNSGAAAMLDLL